LMGTPIMLTLSRRLNISPRPLLLTLAFAITTGSVVTPMGNPQNLLIALASGITAPVIGFASYLLLPTLLNLWATYLLSMVLFEGLFVLMQSLSNNGIIASVAQYLPALGRGDPHASLFSILVSGLLLSQVLSNVPMVALYLPIMKSLSYGPQDIYAWAALAGGSTLAGNLTILGAASNLIIIEEAERGGVKLSFIDFLKVGVLVTAVNFAVLYV